MKDITIPFPVFMGKEGKWFIASCTTLDIALITGQSRKLHAETCNIATQGRTEQEVKENLGRSGASSRFRKILSFENMSDLINEYLRDPDTVKPDIDSMMSVSLTNIPIDIPEGVFHRKTSSVATK